MEIKTYFDRVVVAAALLDRGAAGGGIDEEDDWPTWALDLAHFSSDPWDFLEEALRLCRVVG